MKGKMVKRYEFEEGHRGYPCAVECDDGGYVDYDSHVSELATLRAENEWLRAWLEDIRDGEYAGASRIAKVALK